MPLAFLGPYRDISRYRSFWVFWLGFAFSVLGDAMIGVALTWLVYQSTHSARAVGLLLLASTGPVLVGGLLVGPLLDRFDRRAVMIVDSIVRGLAVATIPLLHALGHPPLWPVYAVAAVYGCLKMITLAGGPALVPALVPAVRLDTANALETLGFTLGGVIGPPVAGLLIARIGAPNVVLVDALSYGAFALALTRVQLDSEYKAPSTTRAYRVRDAVALLRYTPVLFATTLMFMTFNLGEGALAVWPPLFRKRRHDGARRHGRTRRVSTGGGGHPVCLMRSPGWGRSPRSGGRASRRRSDGRTRGLSCGTSCHRTTRTPNPEP